MKKTILLCIVLLIISCNKNLNKIEVVNEYYYLHKKILNTSLDDLSFPKSFKNILSRELLIKEKDWFKKNYLEHISQLIDPKIFYLGSVEINKIEEKKSSVIVYLNANHPEYFIRKKSDLDYLVSKYNCDKSDYDTIIKIDKKLDEMWEQGYIVGKGWYPVYNTNEIHIFTFNTKNQIKKIERTIISGRLIDTYEDVINRVIGHNKEYCNQKP